MLASCALLVAIRLVADMHCVHYASLESTVLLQEVDPLLAVVTVGWGYIKVLQEPMGVTSVYQEHMVIKVVCLRVSSVGLGSMVLIMGR